MRTGPAFLLSTCLLAGCPAAAPSTPTWELTDPSTSVVVPDDTLGTTGRGDGGTGSTGGPAEDSSAAASSGTTGAPFPDLPPQPDLGDLAPEGCKGKIDFLFVISRGATMDQEQDRLLTSLPGFMTTIEDSFADYEPHILVANPDGKWAPEFCDKYLCPTYEPTCGPGAEEYVCYENVSETLCDQEIGAGLLFNAGANATNHPCQLHGANRYIIPGEPDPNAFECIARVGFYGPHTPMRDALFAAVQPEINGPGGCNNGFLRPDALLVVTMIYDSADSKSWWKPQQVHDAVVAAKGGDPDAVVMVVITFPTTNEAQTPGCAFGDWPDPLKDLAGLFSYHVIGDVCADNYTPYLELAAAKVGEACGKFIPQ